MSTQDIDPIDPASPVGQVRLIIDDAEAPYAISDARIQAVLSLYRDDLTSASADLLETIAVNEALLYKYVRTDDLLVDGTKAASVLLERAKRLREQAASEALEDAFEVVPFHQHPSPWPEATARPWGW